MRLRLDNTLDDRKQIKGAARQTINARDNHHLAGVKRIVEAQAQFRSLAEPWADTGTSTGRLMLAVLGGLADVERDLIRTRTAEGRSRARAQGVPLGRPSALTAQQREEANRRRSEGATLAELAKSYDVGISTILRATHLARQHDKVTTDV